MIYERICKRSIFTSKMSSINFFPRSLTHSQQRQFNLLHLFIIHLKKYHIHEDGEGEKIW